MANEGTALGIAGTVIASVGWGIAICEELPHVGFISACPFGQGSGAADVIIPPNGFSFNGRNNVGYKLEDILMTAGGLMMVYAYHLGASPWFLAFGLISVLLDTFFVWIGGFD